MYEGELGFDLVNWLAGFNGGGTGQIADQDLTGLDGIFKVRVGMSQCFSFHGRDYSKVLYGLLTMSPSLFYSLRPHRSGNLAKVISTHVKFILTSGDNARCLLR